MMKKQDNFKYARKIWMWKHKMI